MKVYVGEFGHDDEAEVEAEAEADEIDDDFI